MKGEPSKEKADQALKVARESRLRARNASRKEMADLQRLRKKATEEELPPASDGAST